MSQKFQAAIQHRNDVSYVKLGGVIDEDNELSELVDKIPTGTAVIDLGEIERINSCGVRDWVNWLAKLEHNGTRGVLIECSPAIVAQINLVNNFTGAGVVKSFYVPYFCPECNEEKVLLVEAQDMGPPPHEPPTCRCDECDLVMDFDDMPDSYFAFLSDQRKLAEPDHVNGAMRDLARGGQGAAKVRSRASHANLAPPPGNSLPSLSAAAQRQPPRQSQGYPAPLGNGMGTGPQMAMQSQHASAGHFAPPSHPGHPSPQLGHHAMGHPGHSAPHVPGTLQSGSSAGSQPPSRSNFQQHPSHGAMQSPGPTGPRITTNLPSAAHQMANPGYAARSQKTQLISVPTRSNALVFILIAILLAAIAVLAYLVLTK